MLQLCATALFYLENSRKIHLQGMRACRPKDAKRREWGSVPVCGDERERETDPQPFGSSFYMSFPFPGPALCKLGQPGVLFALPEVLTPVLGPSFVLFSRGFPFLVFSVQFSCSVMSDSLRPRESQHARAPCPSPSPGVHSNPCPLSQ